MVPTHPSRRCTLAFHSPHTPPAGRRCLQHRRHQRAEVAGCLRQRHAGSSMRAAGGVSVDVVSVTARDKHAELGEVTLHGLPVVAGVRGDDIERLTVPGVGTVSLEVPRSKHVAASLRGRSQRIVRLVRCADALWLTLRDSIPRDRKSVPLDRDAAAALLRRRAHCPARGSRRDRRGRRSSLATSGATRCRATSNTSCNRGRSAICAVASCIATRSGRRSL